MRVGEQIRAARKAAKLTQEQLANKLGVRHSVISKYENGMIEPSLTQMEKIAAALDVTPSFLIGYDDKAHWGNMSDEEKQAIQEEVWGLYVLDRIEEEMPEGSQKFSDLIADMGYDFIWDNDIFYIVKDKKRIEISIEEWKTLVQTSKTVIAGLLESLMNKDS